MRPLDWLILLAPMAAVFIIAARTRRHVRGVSDFMTGGRLAGRYMVAVSDGMAAMGLITAVAAFEFMYQSGFAVGHWGQIATPITLLVTLTGFVVYRFRETRAMTLAQFFAVRYSRRFRIFAGALAAVAGIVNYGIFPAVAGRFVIHYCGLPEAWGILGVNVPTFPILMAVFLSIALVMVLFGGHLTVMVTDCVQGIIGYGMYLAIAFAVLSIFSWRQMKEALLDRPPGHSMLNPFDAFALQDFNIWFVLIGVIGGVYMTMAWQGNQGFNCAASSPHEAKMGKILGAWRGGAMAVMFSLLAIAGYTYLHHPDFADGAAAVNAHLASIDNPAIQTQVRVPVAIAHFLPTGVTGMFLAVMLFLMLSTDTAYLHSWGSIIVQDVILPLRNRPLPPEQHLKLLRWSIVGVAVFVFLFSLLFHQTTYILMFFALTGALYLGGAGACIIGGLYWSRGTTAGAWSAMITGATVATLGFVLDQAWPSLAPLLLERFPDSAFLRENQERFFINGQWTWFLAMTSSIAVYVAVSLATCRQPFNMDRMLHRGVYAKEKPAAPAVGEPRSWRSRLLGVDGQFTRGDRVLCYFVFGWSMMFFGVWLVATAWNIVSPWPNAWWATYFWVTGIVVALVMSVITSVWFTLGGIRDLRRMFRGLATLDRNALDDGTVIGHVNAEDLATIVPAPEAAPRIATHRDPEQPAPASPVPTGP